MTTLNVLRYSALFTGVAYGFYHLETLKAQGKQEIKKYNYEQKEKLVADAKREWNIAHPPAVKPAPKDSGADVEVDLDSSNTDWAQVIDDALNAVDPVKD